MSLASWNTRRTMQNLEPNVVPLSARKICAKMNVAEAKERQS